MSAEIAMENYPILTVPIWVRICIAEPFCKETYAAISAVCVATRKGAKWAFPDAEIRYSPAWITVLKQDPAMIHDLAEVGSGWGVKSVRGAIEIESMYCASVIFNALSNVCTGDITGNAPLNTTPPVKFYTLDAKIVTSYSRIPWNGATRALLNPIRAFKYGTIAGNLTLAHIEKCAHWIKKNASSVQMAKILSSGGSVVDAVMEILACVMDGTRSVSTPSFIKLVTKRHVPATIADRIYDIVRDDLTDDTLKQIMTGKSRLTSVTTISILNYSREKSELHEWFLCNVDWVAVVATDPTIISRYPEIPWCEIISRRRQLIRAVRTRNAS